MASNYASIQDVNGGLNTSVEDAPVDFEREEDPMHRLKTIGVIGSIALITNNITGPGMICT